MSTSPAPTAARAPLPVPTRGAPAPGRRPASRPVIDPTGRPWAAAAPGRGARPRAHVAPVPAAAVRAQFVSANLAPGGIGDPGPLQYLLSHHTLDHLTIATRANCLYERAEAVGAQRQTLTGRHEAAEMQRLAHRGRPGGRLGHWLDSFSVWARRQADAWFRRPVEEDAWTRKMNR